MFKGKFKLGGRGLSKDMTIVLYRHNKESEKYTPTDFIKTIGQNEMGWDGVNDRLLYRDEDGKLWKAKFEEYHESEA
jgi:hypothetical protein